MPEKGRIFESTEKGSNLWEYRNIVASRRVLGKCRIRASVKKHSRRVPENGRLNESIGKRSNMWEYRKIIESGRVPGKGRIRATVEKLSR